MPPTAVPFFELCIATMVGAASDKFGLPATQDDESTASGHPLNDNTDAAEKAREWCNALVEQHDWMFRSTAGVPIKEVAAATELIMAAFEGSEDAVLRLKIKCGGLTEGLLDEMLGKFGIRARDGMYHRADFERAWKILEENPNITEAEIRRKLGC